MIKILKYIGYTLLALLVAANIAIWATDSTYIYKALVYQQVDIDDLDLFGYNEIKAGNQPEEWAIGKDNNQQPLSKALRDTLEKYRSVAYLVIKDDSIRHEEYWEGYSPASYSNSFSMAKSVVSMLVGIAIQEGKIKSIDEPVSNYLPEFKEGEKAKITIKHLLQMASGLDFMESYSTPFNYTTEAYYGSDLQHMVSKLKVVEKPGSIYRYKSGDPQVLELILRKATGKTISEYLSEKVWTKIGAMHDAKWSIDHDGGDEKAYCCIYSNARDFARLGKLYMQHGKWKGQQLVDSSWVALTTTPNGLPDEDGNPTSDEYGMQWWCLKRAGCNIFYMRGLGGQYVVCIPEKKTIIVRLGHDRSRQKIDNHPMDVITYIDEALQDSVGN